MTPKKLNDILQRYDQGLCTPEEKAFVEAWYKSLGSRQGDPLNAETRQSIHQRLLEKIEAHVEKNVAPPRSVNTVWSLSLKIAAGLTLIAISLYLLWRPEASTTRPNDLITANTAQLVSFANTGTASSKIMLHDGSIVTLHPHSEIKYPVTFGSHREVYLSGEAFFDVKRDEQRPFLVYANTVTTRVLGTSFLVTAYEHDEQVTVAVKTGSVSVFNPQEDRMTPQAGHEVTLSPNQEAVYTKKQNALKAQPVAKPEALIIPQVLKVRYDASPVTRVFEDLKKTFDVEIRYNPEDFKDYTLTTSLSEESLDNRIGIICKAIGAQYTIQNKVITVDVPARSTATPQ